LNGLYLCMAYWAFPSGTRAGITSPLGNIQPPAAVLVNYGERSSTRSALEVVVAIAGVACVLSPPLLRNGSGDSNRLGLAGIIPVLGILAETLIQLGALASDPVRVSASVQNAGGALVARW